MNLGMLAALSMPLVDLKLGPAFGAGYTGLRLRTGTKHKQHCGARQEARYRRQIAAGQLSYGGKKLVLA